MSGRFPGARNVDEFWRNLASGFDARRPLRPRDLALGGEKLFDAEMFGFTANEARLAGPQHRIFMECAWEALESAGYLSKTSGLRIGLYAGATLSHDQLQVGNDRDYLTTHVSYKLNLRGPSVGVQTACSTSLVAVWLACQGLNSYECDMVLAGGVTVKHASDIEEGFGSGAGVVLLKRLDEAVAECDPILAVIKETAVNNDGAVKMGFTASSLEGQVEVVTLAQATAGVHPESIGYIEAHGSNTPLGDSVEIAALTQVFRRKTQKRGFCAIGSVKSNVGHLESAAGVTGLIKTVLALQHKQIPPSLHFKSPNPEIDFASSPFYVNTELQEWKNGAGPRRAGVSSFGIGGTNAHVILEEAPAIASDRPDVIRRPYHILTLSALETTPLRELAGRYMDWLASGPELDSVCFTSNTGRRHFKQRLAAVVTSTAELREELTAFVAGRESRGLFVGKVHGDTPLKVAFLFTGQGSQYAGMGRELYETQPVFRGVLEQCASILAPLLEKPLLEVLYGSDSEGLLRETAYTQPALFAVEYALAKLWESWGIRPSALLGHSVGEYVAACVAGVFGLEDGLKLVAARGVHPAVELRRTLARIEFRRPEIKLISNVTGEFAGAQVATAEYWMEHMLRSVPFPAGMSRLAEGDCGAILEIGPHPALIGLAPQCAPENGVTRNGKPCLASLRRNVPDWQQMLLTLGRLYLAGAELNWEAFDAPYGPRRITQPTYPFQSKPYWVDQPEKEFASGVSEPGVRAEPQLKAQPNLGSDTDLAGSPQRETEEKLARIWCDLLHLNKVGIDDNFFDLGGHSLLAAKLTERIEKAFGRTLPLPALFEAPTIQLLAALLSAQRQSEVIPGILRIQPDGSRPPFFCVGAGPLFRPLAQLLGLDQPFLGLGLGPEDIQNLPVRFRLEDMAAVLVRKVREIQPTGPYLMGGWCMDGVLAFETARQLLAQDETVALLVLFDARNPKPIASPRTPNSHSSERRRVMKRIRHHHFRNLLGMTMSGRLDYLHRRLQTGAMMLKLIGWELSYKLRLYATDNFKGLPRIFNSMEYVAIRHYLPQTYSGPVLLVQSNPLLEALSMDPQMGWGDVVQGGLEIYSASGGHQGIFKEPHVGPLADKLSACVSRTQTHSTTRVSVRANTRLTD
jgi:acyl transferase domain-containing protein/thioesterase domain-containing protein